MAKRGQLLAPDPRGDADDDSAQDDTGKGAAARMIKRIPTVII